MHDDLFFLMTMTPGNWEIHNEYRLGLMSEEEVEGELSSARKLKEYSGYHFIIEDVRNGDIREVIIP